MNADQLARLLGDDWAIDRDGPDNLARRLALRLRHLIAGEIVPAGTRLPAERSMAAAITVSRPTVTAALDELRALGLVQSRQGSGSWISERAPERGPARAMAEIVFDGRGINLAAAAAADASHLGRLDVGLAELLSASPEHGYDPVGLPQLRAAIAARYTASRLATSEDEIVVTNGAHQALALVLGAFAGAADSVIVEEHTYGGILDLLEAHRALPVPIARDAEGASPDALRRALRRSRPRLVYLTPSVHAPTGSRTTPRRLREIAAVLDRHEAVVIADDTLADLHDGKPLPALASLCAAARVITIGSLSKSAWGGLRIGWVRAGAPLREELVHHRARIDLGTAIAAQHVALQVLARLDELLARRNAELRRRAEHIRRALTEAFPEWEIPLPNGGLSLWARLPGDDAAAFVDDAARHGVLVMPGAIARADRPVADPHVRICFDRDARILDEAVARLSLTSRPAGGRPRDGRERFRARPRR